MDVEDIAPGQNFARTIDQTIAACSHALVIIGPRWMQILDERSQQGGQDYVRHEIESALARKTTTVIPVLVGGATAVQLNKLPASLSELGFREAVELRDSSFNDDCDRLARGLGVSSARRRTLVLAALALAVIFLIFAARYGSNLLRAHNQRQNAVKQLLITAQTQTKLGEYESAYQTATRAVKTAPDDTNALNQQIDSAMLWLEDYSVLVGEGQKAEDVAAPQLTELMLVLDGGLARATGNQPRSADILAHIGWAHWLNQHIAQKEFGPAAEKAFHQALVVQPSNVYANAMLGNWLLQTNGSVAEAAQHFTVALAARSERPLVRTMQLGGMLYNDADGVAAEAVKVLNDMRKNQESIPAAYRTRFLSYEFDGNRSSELLRSMLAAVPLEDVWQTYLWLGNPPADDPVATKRKHESFHARLLQAASPR